MLSATETWSQQTRQNCLDVCAAHDNPIFNNFADRALKALMADELRRYTPHSLAACLWDFWQFVVDSGKKLTYELSIPNPQNQVGALKARSLSYTAVNYRFCSIPCVLLCSVAVTIFKY